MDAFCKFLSKEATLWTNAGSLHLLHLHFLLYCLLDFPSSCLQMLSHFHTSVLQFTLQIFPFQMHVVSQLDGLCANVSSCFTLTGFLWNTKSNDSVRDVKQSLNTVCLWDHVSCCSVRRRISAAIHSSNGSRRFLFQKQKPVCSRLCIKSRIFIEALRWHQPVWVPTRMFSIRWRLLPFPKSLSDGFQDDFSLRFHGSETQAGFQISFLLRDRFSCLK